MSIEKIYPEYIHLDGGTQPRAKIDDEVWQEYGERMKAGDKFPPIIVFFDGENYWLVDGYHRHKAHFMYLPGQAMECEVRQGTLEEAQWYSYTVNRGHGVRRTRDDIRRAVRAALTHPKGAGISDRQIAEHVGAHFDTVAKYRKELERDSTIGKSDSHARSPAPTPGADYDRGAPEHWRPRTGRDGRTINTAKIGKKGKKKKGKAGRGIASSPLANNRGLSQPLEMIALQFCPTNPHTAAATLIQLFPRSFLEGLLHELTSYLKSQGE